MEIIFDGKSVQVIIDRVPESNAAVFSFASFDAHKNNGPAYGNGFLQKNGFTAIFFITKIHNWWQTEEFDVAIEIANEHTRDIKRRITYGQSMGGYGALLASGLLNSVAIVTSPQTTIATKSIPLHPVWEGHISKFPTVRDDVYAQMKSSLNVVVVYDPANSIDHKHFTHISDHPNVTRMIMPFSTHNVPQTMLEMGALSEVMVSLLKYDIQSINDARKKIRSKRLLSPTYISKASVYVSRKKGQYIKKRFFNAMISALSNPEFDACDLSHIRKTIESDAYRHFWAKSCLDIDGFDVVSINDVDILEPRFALFKSTGNDPQLILNSKRVSRVKHLCIHINSSVKSTAGIYYSTKKDARQYNSRQVLAHPVKIGHNKLNFTIPDECCNSDIRFDPLTCEGLFSILSITSD